MANRWTCRKTDRQADREQRESHGGREKAGVAGSPFICSPHLAHLAAVVGNDVNSC